MPSRATTMQRPTSAATISRRRSTRSAMAPVTSEKSSQGSRDATVTPAMAIASRVSDAARSGKAVRNIPSPVLEMATEVHRARKGAPRWRGLSAATTQGARYVAGVARWRRAAGDGTDAGPIARDRRLLDIHDNIVQGLAEAQLALDVGRTAQAREAIESTLAQARRIVTELTDLPGAPSPGDLRRSTPADQPARRPSA